MTQEWAMFAAKKSFELERFPDHAPTMRKPLPAAFIAALLYVSLLVFRTDAQTSPDAAKWEKEIAAFEASDKTKPPPQDGILFIGSSSIRMWTTLAADFPGQKVINRGFGGSQIIDSVHFMNRIVVPYRPKMIVLYAGGNDINAGKSPDQVFADFKMFVENVRRALPQTRIAYISIAPNPARWAQVEKVRAANKLIEDFITRDTRLAFINVFPQMLGEDGRPKPDIYRDDKLHMNAKGYELWVGIVKPYLSQAR
jgi:lysophospholipase L1-like esterase